MSDYKVGEEFAARVEGRTPQPETFSDTIKSHIPFTEAHRKAELGEELKEAREELKDVENAAKDYQKHVEKEHRKEHY